MRTNTQTIGPSRDSRALHRRDFLANAAMTRDPERNGVLKTCEELGIGFVPWGPVGMGYLTGKIDAQTKFDRSDPGHTPTGPPGRNLGAINVQLTPGGLREMDTAFSKLLLVDTLLAY